ncbi:hypothetical protein Nepgr_031503 [Nepenthes gracilis]|uniref:Uncharacterized protein n=1 Tax=Nepenthes gracilis TaxID=150966 RepID=A0AAD3TGV0_NEPGR|nr:hypothetical protein Nepgr_031503 [Nepenthes gracilis]
MICPFSATKSASNWLDRLRLSRGFPTGDDDNLDHFLTNGTSDSSNVAAVNNWRTSNSNAPDKSCSESTHSESAQSQEAENDRRVIRNDSRCPQSVTNSILCQLFNMGDGNEISRKKSSRKQANPKFCVVSTSKSVNEFPSDYLRRVESENALVLSADNGLDKRREEKEDSVFVAEDEDVDLSAYSRSEVTVIDTSFEEWKFERLVFRRRNVWKVREKKRKNFGGKKRKACALDEKDNENKFKVPDSAGSLLKERKRVECIAPPNEGQRQNSKVEEPCKETADVLGQLPIKRFPSSSKAHQKSKPVASSVILVKAIPYSEKMGAKKWGKSSLQNGEKKLSMKIS